MGVFNPGERATFDRIARALEDCAEALKKIATPPREIKAPWRTVPPHHRKTHHVSHELAARLLVGEEFRGGAIESITVHDRDCDVVVIE